LTRVPGVSLLSLQVGPGSEQLAQWDGRSNVIDVGKQFDQTPGALMDAAAVLKNLDLLVSCDTSLAHLAGAMGLPVWLVLPFAADWRWLHDREDSPWYPTMRLFRQKQRGDWGEVFARIAGEVVPLMSSPVKFDFFRSVHLDSFDFVHVQSEKSPKTDRQTRH
jgi:hypothetical protein